MNKQLIENIKLKSDLQYDLLFESHEYDQLDSDLKSYLKESYDSGVNFSINIQKDTALLEMVEKDPMILESIDEGLWDRFKAGTARTVQAIKNVAPGGILGKQTADSKDAGVQSLFNSFKNKFQKASAQQSAPAGKLGDEVVDKFKEIEDNSKKGPPIDPNQGLKMVDNSNAPKGLKDKIKQAIINNPGKAKFLLGVLSFGAGVAAAAITGGNPIAGKIAGSLINGIGNAAIAKAQGRGNGDAVMAGFGGALAGYGLANLGATATNAITNFATGLIPGADPNAYQVTKTAPSPSGGGSVPTKGGGAYPFPETDPNKLYPDTGGGASAGSGNGGAYPFAGTDPNKLYPDNGGASGAGSGPYQAYDPNQPNYTGGSSTVGTTNGGTTSGGGAYPFAGTDPNKLYPDTGATTDQAFPGTKPEDIVPGSANDPNQGMYTTAASAAKKIPRPNYEKGAELLNRGVRGVRRENLEKTFTKSYNNTYVLNKKSNVISESEVEEMDEAWEENINEALNAEQQKAFNEFLTDLGKTFKISPDQVIPFMQSQGSRFKDILDFISQNVQQSATPPQQPQQPQSPIPSNVIALIDKDIQSFTNGFKIINPKIAKLTKTVKTTRTNGKGFSYVFRLNKSGDIAFIIKGWLGQTPFLYQEKPTVAQQNAQNVLIKEIAYKPIDVLLKKFMSILSKTLAFKYKNLTPQLPQQNLEVEISNYISNNQAFMSSIRNNIFNNITILLDSVLNRIKVAKTKPQQIWIGINNKGTGLFTGIKPKSASKPNAGNTDASKPDAGNTDASKPDASKPDAGEKPEAEETGKVIKRHAWSAEPDKRTE